MPIITGRWFGADYLAEQRERIDASYAAEGLGGQVHELGILRFVCVTESDEETLDYLVNARQQMRFAAALRNRQEAMDGGMLVEKPFPGEPPLEEMAASLPVGDAATVAARLTADIRASGASHMMLNIQAAGLHHGAGRAHHPGLRQRDQARHRARPLTEDPGAAA